MVIVGLWRWRRVARDTGQVRTHMAPFPKFAITDPRDGVRKKVVSHGGYLVTNEDQHAPREPSVGRKRVPKFRGPFPLSASLVSILVVTDQAADVRRSVLIGGQPHW